MASAAHEGSLAPPAVPPTPGRRSGASPRSRDVTPRSAHGDADASAAAVNGVKDQLDSDRSVVAPYLCWLGCKNQCPWRCTLSF